MTPLGNTGSSFTYQRLVTIVTELVKIALQIGEFIAVGMIIYYGLRMAMSRGDDKQFSDAKNGLKWAILGAVIVFGVYTIIATVQGAVESVGR